MRPGIVEDLLTSAIGLDPQRIGSGQINRAVAARMAACGLGDRDAYLRLLHESEDEVWELIEHVVVPESWFFRDGQPFAFLQQSVRDSLLRDPARPPFRLLSLPCAGGEEPFTIAMALLDAGLTVDQFHIDAVDVSNRSLELARLGVFTQNAFRGSELAFRDRYFLPHPRGFELKQEIRKTARFVRANLLEPDLFLGEASYDVIFCRNVLIYLTTPARVQAMATLDRLLARDGLLFLGHSETLAAMESRLVPVCDKRSFAYRRSPDGPPTPARRPPALSPPRAATPIAKREGRPHAPRQPAKVTPAPDPQKPPTSPRLLEQASGLANQGQYDRAAQLCEQSLREDGPTAQAYFLLGTIRQAAGDDNGAEPSFQKAVYLDSRHDEALLSLALIAQRRGDQASSAGYRRRARRAHQGKEGA
jgi:chemotaxis protein methyltransferase WspC